MAEVLEEEGELLGHHTQLFSLLRVHVSVQESAGYRTELESCKHTEVQLPEETEEGKESILTCCVRGMESS